MLFLCNVMCNWVRFVQFWISRNNKISLFYNNMLPSVLFLSYAEKNVHRATSPLFVDKTERSCINACTGLCLVYINK